MKKKRHHHYIWRDYLRPWSTNEKIACLREGKLFEPNLMGIGQEKDFYKLKELNSDELKFIASFINNSREHLQKLHTNLLKQFNLVFQFKEVFESKGINGEEANNFLETMIYNFEENLHADIEISAMKYIESILQEDIRFYDTDEGCMDFIYFLSVQFWRTNKSKQNAFKALGNIPKINIENVWNILSHIFATNMGWVLYAERKVFKMILLKNETAKEFITGDQPVVNTYAYLNSSKTPPDEIELYYPVSPQLAILISEREEYKGIRLKWLNENDVISYNSMIVINSYNQIYATTVRILEEYKDLQIP